MKFFKDIEILYEKYFIISKYCLISNSNVNTIITNMNNIESSTDSDSNNEVYDINNNNNIVNNSRINDSENRNIDIRDNENNSIVTNNVVNSSIGEIRVKLCNSLNNECVNIYVMRYRLYNFLLGVRDQTLLI